MKNTNWAILGLGKIATKFAEDLLLTKNATLYAVASRDQSKATSFANDYNAQVAYGSYQAMLEDPKVDIVYIATPHAFHKEQTLLCLNNGKPVLCEKAFALNKKDVLEMIAFAKAKNVFLMEALWTHFLPHYKFVLSKIADGDLGSIKSIDADFGIDIAYDPKNRLYNKSVGGGSLLDVGIYPVFAALSLLGYTNNITAQAEFGPTDVDHRCKMTLRYPNGVEARLFSAIDKKTDTTCTILLEGGEIVINSRFHEPSNVTITTNKLPITYDFPIPKGVNGYHYEILHCQEMLKEGRNESPVMSFQKSLELIDMLDIVRSEIGLNYW